MLRNRDNRTGLFPPVPQPGLRFEPPREQLDRLPDDGAIVDGIRTDTARRSPRARSRGRPPTPVEVLRRPVVMRRDGRGEAQAESFVNDRRVPRPPCRAHPERAPDDTAPSRRANTLGPEALG